MNRSFNSVLLALRVVLTKVLLNYFTFGKIREINNLKKVSNG
jgi:hypothetical protein